MTLKYKPLEESVTRLTLCVKKEDVKSFDRESKVFYEQMSVLASYHWMKDSAIQLVNRYQNQYNQLKFQLTANQR